MFFFPYFFLTELSLEILSWESRQEMVIFQVPLSQSVFKTPPSLKLVRRRRHTRRVTGGGRQITG